MNKPDPLGEFFGVSASLSNCAKDSDGTTDFGEIVSVSFEPAPTYYPVRVIVNTRLGKATIPDSVLEKCGEGPKSVPGIRTLAARYDFEFDGKKVTSRKGNPPMLYDGAIAPTTSDYMPK